VICFGSKADIEAHPSDVRFTRKSGQRAIRMSALCQKRTHAVQQFYRYSITSSARPDSGTVMPSALAVFMDCPTRFKDFWQNTLAAVVKDDDARADEFCATENPAGFDTFDNNREAKAIVQRLSNPMMLFGDITKVNGAMIIRHAVITSRIGALTDEFKCLACPKVFIGITAAINPGGRFVS
jgi:hypothetical protein